VIAKRDEARLAKLSTWCWSFHCWRGGVKSVRLSTKPGCSKVLTKWPARAQLA